MPARGLFFALGLWASACTLHAQFTDSFTDSDYSANPNWNGDTARFDVSPAGQLWLHAPPADDKAFLSLPSMALPGASWEFFLRMDFNPSSSNYARVYLSADQQDLFQPLNGYYVQAGGSGDDLRLYRQEGSQHTLLVDGADGLLNTSQVHVRIRVERDLAGQWQLQADTSGGVNYTLLGVAADAVVESSYYFGVCCIYTSTRSDKFYFDDFSVTGLPFPDVTEPYVTSCHITGSDSLSIWFSEPVTTTSVQQLSYYLLDNGMGNPLSASVDPQEIRRVNLRFAQPFFSAVLYHLQLGQVSDWQGNQVADTLLLLADYTPLPGDVVINEIMADPQPQVGLPDAEYIELYNRTAFPIPLSGWQLRCGAVLKTLPEITLMPDSFLVIADAGHINAFSPGTPVYGLSAFPSLTNSGMAITLTDTLQAMMDSVFYTAAWYHDPLKADGGYALERINPGDRCGQGNNWMASVHFLGGTPGATNSVWNDAPPLLHWISAVQDSMHILLVASRELDTTLISSAVFSAGCGVSVSGVMFLSADSILLSTTLLPADTLCSLYMNGTLMDCMGNSFSPAAVVWMYYRPAPLDIIFHELMLDESPPVLLPETEYIELYNRRSFPVSLKGWRIETTTTSCILPDLTIAADSFMVLVPQDQVVYFQGLPVGGCPVFPALANTSGQLRLYAPDSTLVHSLRYTDDWYQVSGKEDGGWSLEMIDHHYPCLGDENWRASNDPAGGSPGMDNSFLQSLTDTAGPRLRRTGFVYPDTVLLYFTEPVYPLALTPGKVHFSAGLTTVDVEFRFPSWDRVAVSVQPALLPGVVYNVWLQNTVTDCAGNMIGADTQRVTMPHAPAADDIRINEVLFDPPEESVDYVELVHIGEHAIDLRNLLLAEGDTQTQYINNPYPVTPSSILFFPGEYLLLSVDGKRVREYYATTAPLQFIDMEGFPVFPNDAGTVAVTNLSQQVMDMLAYADDMHFPLLSSADGVSLERVYPDGPTQDVNNWHSASSVCGYGTPGYQNSQYLPGTGSLAEHIVLDTEIFSPDNDGYQDVLTVRYQLDQPEYAATFTFYDAAGHAERLLVNNALLGTEGFFTWDGMKDDGSVAPAGMHILCVDLFHPDGHSEQIRKVCVVAVK